MRIKASRLKWTITPHTLTLDLVTRFYQPSMLGLQDAHNWSVEYESESKNIVHHHDFAVYNSFYGGYPKSISPAQLVIQFAHLWDRIQWEQLEQQSGDYLTLQTFAKYIIHDKWEVRPRYNEESPCYFRPLSSVAILEDFNGKEPKTYHTVRCVDLGYLPIDLLEALR